MKIPNQRQVEAFRAVILTGSMTAAANFLYITQPAVSRLVRDLERAVGMALFTRHGSRLQPTMEARLLYQEVERSFTGLDQIAKAATEIRLLQTGSLRIAAMPGLALGYLTDVLRGFVGAHPRLSVTLHAHTSQDILNLVSTNQFDLGVGAAPMEHPGVATEPLPTLEAVCVVPAGHALAARKEIHAADLAGATLISLGRSSLLRFRVDTVLHREAVACERRIEANIGTSICSLVGAGLGLAVVDPFTAAYVRDPRLARRPFRPRIPYECALVTPAYMTRSKIVDEFVTSLRQRIAADFQGAPGTSTIPP